MDPVDSAPVEAGRVYSAEEIGQLFGFHPYYLRTAGGMIPVPARNSLLLVTHAARDASFEYGDYWDGEELIYTGRGQVGDQTLTGANLDVAENRRTLWLFEHLGKYQRRCLGEATCTSYWWAIAPDKSGQQRRVLRFSLRLRDGSVRPRPALSTAQRPPQRLPRPFDESYTPSPRSPASPLLAPEEIAQLIEKANAAHHALLVALKRWLQAGGWTDLEEIPGAVDLWARGRDGVRVLFEVKTIAEGMELGQTRSALAQLLEYRFFYGDAVDLLCVVVDAPLADRRLRFLAAMDVHVLWFDGSTFHACGHGPDRIFGKV